MQLHTKRFRPDPSVLVSPSSALLLNQQQHHHHPVGQQQQQRQQLHHHQFWVSRMSNSTTSTSTSTSSSSSSSTIARGGIGIGLDVVHDEATATATTTATGRRQRTNQDDHDDDHDPGRSSNSMEDEDAFAMDDSHIHNSIHQTCNDVYDESVMVRGNFRGDDTVEELPMHQQWIQHTDWISASRLLVMDNGTAATGSIELEHHQQQQQQQQQLLEAELQTLKAQLLHVKRRLGPAADQFATAMATGGGGRHHWDSTVWWNRHNYSRPTEVAYTAARRACNPYEALDEQLVSSHRSTNNSNRSKHHQGRRKRQQQYSHKDVMYYNHNDPCGQQHQHHSQTFINRSAIKLANINAMMGFRLTDMAAAAGANSPGGVNMDDPATTTQPFVFVDLCAAPGGFSEYMLYQLQQQSLHLNHSSYACRGYGMSLRPSSGSSYNNTNSNSNSQQGALAWKWPPPTQTTVVSSSYPVTEAAAAAAESLSLSMVDNMAVAGEDDTSLPRSPSTSSSSSISTSNHPLFRYAPHPAVQYTICHGANGTGDVCHWDNIHHLYQTIQWDLHHHALQHHHHEPLPILGNSNSNNNNCISDNAEPALLRGGAGGGGGVAHIVLCDGGLDQQRNSEDQEGTTLRLVVCQVAAALALCRMGGTLIIKMFGFQSSTTRLVMQSLIQLFENVAITKPITSRPASAERYVVCHVLRYSFTLSEALQWRNVIFWGRLPSRLCSSVILSSNALSLQTDTSTPSPSSLSTMDYCQRVNQILDRTDRDLMKLNLKACFAILSYMERQSMVTGYPDRYFDTMEGMGGGNMHDEQQMESDDGSGCPDEYDNNNNDNNNNNDDDEDDNDDVQEAFVNVKAYRHAWHLY